MLNNLKKIRESKGMSQEFVAKALNVSRQSVSKWENNKAFPDIENIKLLSQLYQISIDEILDNNIPSDKNIRTVDFDSHMHEKNIYRAVYLLTIVLITSSFISVIGFLSAIVILLKTWRKKYPYYFYVLCIICLVINIINMGIFFNSLLFHIGITVIQ